MLDRADEQLRTHTRYIRQQTCFECSGSLETDAESDTDSGSTSVVYESTCDRRPVYRSGLAARMAYPAVLGLCWERGTVTDDTRLWELQNGVEAVRRSIDSEDLLRLRVTVEVAGETQTVEIDDSATVRAVGR